MPLELKTLIYVPSLGRDTLVTLTTLPVEPNEFKTPQEAADALFEALDNYATANGYSEGSVGLVEPDVAAERGYGRQWMVTWEDGPFEWAINMSYQMTGPWGYTEPFHNFDLCFTQ